MKYAEYLRSEWWLWRRERALVNASHRCQSPCCRLAYLRELSNEELALERDEMLPPHAYRLEVHHLSYANVGNEPPDDLIVLCPECHATVHQIDYADQPFSTAIGDALAAAFDRMTKQLVKGA